MGETLHPSAPSTLLGGRFELGDVIDEDAFGARYEATDRKNGRAIEVKVFDPNVLGEDGPAALWEACQDVAKVRMPGIQAVYGVGAAPRGASFIACQRITAKSLHQLLPALHERGPLSLGGALALVHRAATILERAGEAVVHGAIRPRKIFLDERGEVTIGGFEGRAILDTAGANAFPKDERARLSPEVKSGVSPTARCDVFGLGALLFELITGRSPASGFTLPSEAHSEADRAVDELVKRALAAETKRFESSAALARAIEPLLEARGLSSREDLVRLLGLAALPAAPVVDHDAALDDPSARYMVTSGGLDHGPFPMREVIRRAASGAFEPRAVLLDLQEKTRITITEVPALAKALEAHLSRESKAIDALEAEIASEKEASAKTKTIWMGGAAAIALTLAAVAFVLTRGESVAQEIEESDFAELYEMGEIEVRGTAEVLAPPSAKAPRGGGGSSHRAGSYEAAMMKVVDLGDVRSAGGQGQLSTAQVASILDRRLGTIARRCLSREPGQAKGLGDVPLDIAIGGDGRVMGVSTRSGGAAFRTCVDKAVSGVRFPPFGAPRMGVRYSFRVE
jgi:serine/threonine protein kinase